MSKRKPFKCPTCGDLALGNGWTHTHRGVAVKLVETTLPSEPLDKLEAEVNRLERPLRNTAWPAMSYMAIPSLLDLADLLVLRIDASAGADPARAAALRKRLVHLRKAFKRTS